MKAPALAGARPIKGRLPSFSDGKVHVVDFWATWCAPCRTSIPHLSELARKYAGTVEIVGISVWEPTSKKAPDSLPYVEEFVKRQGRRMEFDVAADAPSGRLANYWIDAPGRHLIPPTIVVDRQGLVAWIGTVFDLDAALAAVVARSKSPAAVVAEAQARHKAALRRFNHAAERGDLNAVFELRKQLPPTDSMAAAYKLLRAKDPLAAKIFVQTIMRDPTAGMWQFLDLAWCTVSPSVESSLSDNDFAVQLIKIAEQRADPSNESELACLEYLVFAYLKSNDFADAAKVEARSIAIMEANKTKDYSAELLKARKSLAAYRAGLRT